MQSAAPPTFDAQALSESVQSLRADVGSLRKEMKEDFDVLRKEVKTDIDGVRKEMKEDIGEFRFEVHELGKMRGDIGEVGAEIRVFR